MAITDKSFTGQELDEALKATPALMEIMKGVLKQNKMTLRTETEETAFVANVEDTAISKKTKEHAEALEKDVEELTGIKKKDANEKYYDYFKRAVGEKLGAVKKLEDEIKDLKKNPNPSDADKKRIEQLEKTLTDQKADFEAKLTEKDKSLVDLQVKSMIDTTLAGLRTQYKKDIPENIVKIVEAQVTADLTKAAKLQADGTITFTDEKGEVILNKSTYKPEGAEAIIKERLVDVIDTGKKQEGGGTKEDTAGGPGGGTGGGTGTLTRITALPQDVKSKMQLTDHLLKNGYLDGSAEFTEDFNKFGDKLPLR